MHQTEEVKITDNLQYFYSEFEDNPKIDMYDRFMNMLFKIVYTGSIGLVFFLLFLHFNQKHKAQKYASLVTKANPKSGDEAIVTGERMISVYVDGKLLQVIDTADETDKDDIKISNGDFNRPTAVLLKKALKHMISSS